jgi:hypothetical protein
MELNIHREDQNTRTVLGFKAEKPLECSCSKTLGCFG